MGFGVDSVDAASFASDIGEFLVDLEVVVSSEVELHRIAFVEIVDFASPKGRPWSKGCIRRRGIERTWMRTFGGSMVTTIFQN